MSISTSAISSMMKITDTMISFMDFSGKYIFIRYNPDPYKDADGKQGNPKFDTRLALLEQLINMLTRRINNELNTELVEIHHICYDKSR